jgi:hypothetical protein
MSFLFVSVVPKYLNFSTFSNLYFSPKLFRKDETKRTKCGYAGRCFTHLERFFRNAGVPVKFFHKVTKFIDA